MRLERLELLAFGPFSGGALDLGARTGAVDLVYGPNEAGKSTTLRAIAGLFFGISDTRDAHRHETGKLRIGGSVRTSRGERVEFVRRKGRKATLLDAEGRALDDAVLEPIFRGITREIFGSLFGLDHVTLRASAEELLAGKGNVGESLFSAGIGGRGLHELRVRLDEEAARLFVPRARERTVNKAMAEVEAARDTLRAAVTSPAKYLEQVHAYEAAVRARDTLKARRTERVAEQGRWNRMRMVLPHLRRRAELALALQALGEVAPLSAGAPEERRRAVQGREEAVRELARLGARRAELERRFSEIVVPAELLGLDEARLSVVREGLSRHLAAQADRPKLEAKMVGIEASVRRSLERLGVARESGDLQVSLAGSARVRGLSARRQRLEDQLFEARRVLADARAREGHLLDRLSVRAGSEERGALRDALAHAARVPVPSPETVDRFLSERSALDVDEERLLREAEKIRERRVLAARKLEELRQLGDVPSEAELVEQRARRDGVFRALKDEASRAPAPVARVAEFEQEQSATDSLADRLRREAARVAERARLEADLRTADIEAEANASAERELGDRKARHETDWVLQWRAVRMTPLPPAEMRAWARDFGALLDVQETKARKAAELAEAEEAFTAWRAEWDAAVQTIGLPASATPEEAVTVLDKMTLLMQQAVEAGGLRSRIEGIERDSARFAEGVAALCRRVLPEAVALDAGDAAALLLRDVEGARAAHAEKRTLSLELERLLEVEQAQLGRKAEASSRIEALLSAARAPDLDALVEVEKRADEARQLREQLARLDEEIALAGDGASLEAIESEARGKDLDEVRARLRDIEGELSQLGDEIDAASQTAWSLERHVHNMEHTDAAEAAAVLQDRVARLKRHAHRYLRVKLASVVLDREIERYRQENQGPLLARACELFPRLTLGRYAGLRAGVDDGGDPVLLAVRADGVDVDVAGLSDGTRDQLYLALRLASLERYLRANEPMPLVLDDVLVHFDDDRARAALSVLGDVAQLTQVLFFTHHARIADLAREVLGPGRLTEHRLPAATDEAPSLSVR